MAFDCSTLFWIFLAIMVLQPLFTGRWYALRRAQAIRAIESLHGSRVITMIHRQEKRSLFGFAVSRHIDLEGAQTIIAAIKDTPDDMPIDLVIHTPGGLVLAAMQIARAVEAHKAKVTVYVPVYAMPGGWPRSKRPSKKQGSYSSTRATPATAVPACGSKKGDVAKAHPYRRAPNGKPRRTIGPGTGYGTGGAWNLTPTGRARTSRNH